MGSVKITTYQIINYFFTGFVVVFSCFLFYFLHPCGILADIKTLSLNHFTIGFILSCFAGIVINAFRNTVIEFLLFERLCKQNNKFGLPCRINWDFFHTADKDKLDQVESSYYVFYSGALNLSIAFSISGFLVCISPFWFSNGWLVVLIYLTALILFIYGIWPLRRQMIRATWGEKNWPYYNFEKESSIKSRCVCYKFWAGIIIVFISCGTGFLIKKSLLYDQKTIYCCCQQTIVIDNTEAKTDTLSIGPFKSGFNVLQNPNDSVHQFSRLKNLINSNTYEIIYLLSGVDKRPLKNNTARIYKENLNLAQSRANVVKRFIEQQLSRQAACIVVCPQGAGYYGEDPDSLARDRYVYIKLHEN